MVARRLTEEQCREVVRLIERGIRPYIVAEQFGVPRNLVSRIMNGHTYKDVQRKPFTEQARFWSRVNKDGPVPEKQPDLGPCWLWTAGLNSAGYSCTCIRVSYMCQRTRILSRQHPCNRKRTSLLYHLP